jgi:hypothetical protein
MVSDIIQIAFLIIFCVTLIRLNKKTARLIAGLEAENKKIRENYNNTLKDLIASYHMLIAAHDGHLTIEEINEFINKPTQNGSNN